MQHVLASALGVPTCPVVLNSIESLSSFDEDLHNLSSKIPIERTSFSNSTIHHEFGNGYASIKYQSSTLFGKYYSLASNG